MTRSTSSATFLLRARRTTSLSCISGLRMAAPATTRLESRTRSMRSSLLPSMARRIFCDMVISARRL